MFRKTGTRLILAVGITAVTVIGIYTYINIKSQSDVLLAEVERHANQLSETIKKSTRTEMLYNRRNNIHTIINTIGEEKSIKNVRILNKEGRIIYSTYHKDIGEMVNLEAESCYKCHAADQPLEKLSIKDRTRIFRLEPDSARMLGIITPIYNEASCYTADCHAHSPDKTVLGVLDINLDLKDVDDQIAGSTIRAAVFSIVAIISISLIIAVFVKIFIAKPIRELADATKQVADGNLNYRIDLKINNEIGLLARSFNNMTQKLAEARMQLFQSDKMASLGRLAAGVAHEINNPLTGVLTYSSFLLKRTKDQPEIYNDLEVIVRETKRSREIVKSLLDFSRQSVPKKLKADINNIIRHSSEILKQHFETGNTKLELDLSDNLPSLLIDSSQMEQVFINLIVNAVDAVQGKDGVIAITSHVYDRKAEGLIHLKQAECPKRHSLIDPETKIDGFPAVKLQIKTANKIGFLYHDSLYGVANNKYSIEYSQKEHFDIQCPKCERSLLVDEEKCPKCESAVYSIDIPGQGNLLACTNQNCRWEYWKYIEEEGPKEFVEITVSDNGCGIPPENMDKIFEPFFTTKGQKGTGLGLAVIWGIIDNHDGTITVESKKNSGTKFIIKLPV